MVDSSSSSSRSVLSALVATRRDGARRRETTSSIAATKRLQRVEFHRLSVTKESRMITFGYHATFVRISSSIARWKKIRFVSAGHGQIDFALIVFKEVYGHFVPFPLSLGLPRVPDDIRLRSGSHPQRCITSARHPTPTPSSSSRGATGSTRESNNRIKCQVYPSMQLGGTPPQLIDRVRDGTVDVNVDPPGYTAGRFPLIEVFELPFMMQNPRQPARRSGDYVQQYDKTEFRMHPIAFHVHGDGVVPYGQTAGAHHGGPERPGCAHRPARPTSSSLRWAPRQSQCRCRKSAKRSPKGVIDGAVVPYEVVPSVKIQELVKFHSETDPSEPAFHIDLHLCDEPEEVRLSACRPERRSSTPTAVRRSQARSAKIFLEADGEVRSSPRKHLQRDPENRAGKLEESWSTADRRRVAEVTAKGRQWQTFDGARALIAKHSGDRKSSRSPQVGAGRHLAFNPSRKN